MMVDVIIKGIPKLNKAIEKRIEQLKDAPNRAIHQAGLYLEGEIKESIAGRRVEPRSWDTGNLARSVSTDNKEELISYISTNVQYAKFIEFGTTRIHPRMHFRNSAERNKSKISKMVKDSIKKAIKNR